jgi:hypothetical protein
LMTTNYPAMRCLMWSAAAASRTTAPLRSSPC